MHMFTHVHQRVIVISSDRALHAVLKGLGILSQNSRRSGLASSYGLLRCQGAHSQWASAVWVLVGPCLHSYLHAPRLVKLSHAPVKMALRWYLEVR